MGKTDWDVVTNYSDAVTTALKTVTFPKVQEQVYLRNQGNANLTYTIGSQSGTLTPGQSVTVNQDVSSFTLQATTGTHTFEVRAKEKGTEISYQDPDILTNVVKQGVISPIGFRDLSVSQGSTGRSNTNQTTTSRVRIFPKYDCQDLILVFTNLYRLNGNTLAANTNSITVKASLEINGTLIPVFFNAKRNVTIEGGGAVHSDPIGCLISPSDTVCVRTYADAGASGYLPTTISLQQIGSFIEGFSTGADLTDSGTVANISGGSQSAYTPTTVYGKVKNSLKSYILAGDSIMDGSGDIPQLTGNSGFVARRLFNDKIGYTKIALGGETTTSFLQYLHLRTPLIKNHTGVICDYGINDVLGGSTIAATQANLLKIWKYFAAKGLDVYQTTLTPRTTSTDNWLTLANQTISAQENVRLAINAWLRDTSSNGAVAQSGGDLLKVLDSAAMVENNGKWIEFSNPLFSGTVQSAAAGSITDTNLSSVITANVLSNNAIVKITGGTGAGQQRTVSWHTNATTLNMSANWTVTPDATSTYQVFYIPTVDGTHPSAKCHDLMSQAINI
ncbi:SGNH/GDSL hydrolase family protein [Neobacillus drentensis]|uniref:SGNH/GDSL hydrolase family protein n=1 Tax=Neobacillus drentensis TaxID=220684 RepID=UPI001F1BC9C5|nr:SGNH/GDSL hydrolase family protein [Neobacillus drentensis]ULT55398.1 SGNH/GDSL hydrolase family protein [Neobacillus drentensis]